jgi:hypothetical protein
MIRPIIVITLVVGKLADAATLYVRMVRHAKASANALSPRRPDDSPETPESFVFTVLQHRLPLLKEQKRRMAEQGTLTMFGLFWRTPVFLGATTLILAPTTPHADDALVLIAAVGCVAVALNPVVTVLAAVGLRFDSEAVLAVGGLHPKRASDRSRKAEDASSPVVVLIGEVAAYLRASLSSTTRFQPPKNPQPSTITISTSGYRPTQASRREQQSGPAISTRRLLAAKSSWWFNSSQLLRQSLCMQHFFFR